MKMLRKILAYTFLMAVTGLVICLIFGSWLLVWEYNFNDGPAIYEEIFQYFGFAGICAITSLISYLTYELGIEKKRR